MVNIITHNDVSDYSFFKPGISELGIQALMVFKTTGIPLLSRFYTPNINFETKEFLIVSAFMSSISNYIKSQSSEYFSDFGIGQSRFFLKYTRDQKIFCLVVSEVVYRRLTGEKFNMLIEMTLSDLIKTFNNYHKMTKTKSFIQSNYLEKFTYQFDNILFFNFKRAIEELKKSEYTKTERQIDNFKVIYLHRDDYSRVNHELLIKGILGLIIFDADLNPIIARDYALYQNYETNKDYYTGISSAIKSFAEKNLGFVTDIGLGNTRVLIKHKQDLSFCMVVSEVLFLRVTGETLYMFLELTLNEILKSFKTYIELFNFETMEKLPPEEKEAFDEQIDLLLLENSKTALAELNF